MRSHPFSKLFGGYLLCVNCRTVQISICVLAFDTPMTHQMMPHLPTPQLWQLATATDQAQDHGEQLPVKAEAQKKPSSTLTQGSLRNYPSGLQWSPVGTTIFTLSFNSGRTAGQKLSGRLQGENSVFSPIQSQRLSTKADE